MVSDIADSIGYWVTVCEDLNLPKKYLKTLNDIDCKYLQKVAKKYLNPKNVSVSILLPKGENNAAL